jgi:hypothetical protein
VDEDHHQITLRQHVLSEFGGEDWAVQYLAGLILMAAEVLDVADALSVGSFVGTSSDWVN